MKLNELAPAKGATTSRKRVGRGHGSGYVKTAGRGHKGQRARAGSKSYAWFEGGQMPLQRRLPKRGFKNLFKECFAVVNVGQLAKHFQAGEVVDFQALREKGLVKKPLDGIKLLGHGEIAAGLTVKVDRASQAAIQKVEAAGGKVELSQPAAEV